MQYEKRKYRRRLIRPEANLQGVDLSFDGFILRQCFFHAVFCEQLWIFPLVDVAVQQKSALSGFETVLFGLKLSATLHNTPDDFYA